jgi:hypothetical protein
MFLQYLIVFLLPSLLCCAQNDQQPCKRLFYCKTGEEGLGDQLERYFYCVYMAKLLRIDISNLIVEGFVGHSVRGHHGMSEYPYIAKTFGINVNSNITALGGLQHIHISLPEAEKLHKNFNSNTDIVPCSVYYSSDIYSCGYWCSLGKEYKAIKHIRGYLQEHGQIAKSKCIEQGYRNFDTEVIQIVWHVRGGDLCLHCDTNYQRKLYEAILPVLVRRNITWNITIESQGDLSWVKKDAMFSQFYLTSHSTLMATLCRFLTANILITSGSTLPLVIAAYAQPWSPIILEECRKEGTDKYFFSSDEAILIKEGKLQISEQDFYNILMVNTKYMYRSTDW